MADSRSRAELVIAAVDRLTQPVRRMNDAISRMTRPIRRVRRAIRDLGEAAGFRHLAHSIQRTSTSLRGLGAGVSRSMGRLSALGGIIGIGGGGLVAGLGAMVSGQAAAAKETVTWARRLGVTTTALQELTFAGRSFGVNTDALIDGLKELSMRADEFAVMGAGPAAEAFERLGLSGAQLEHVKGDTEALFDLVRSKMQGITNVAERQRIADELLGGQAGEQMVAMLTASSERVRDLRQEAHALGAVMSEEALAASHAFAISQGRLGAALKGVRHIIGAELMPDVTRLTNRVVDFIKASKELIKAKVAEWADRVRRVFAELQDPTSDLRQRIAGLVEWLRGAWTRFEAVSRIVGGPAKAALIGLGLVIAGPMIASVASLAASVVTLGGAMARVAVSAVPMMASAVGGLLPRMSRLRGAFVGASMNAGLFQDRLRGGPGRLSRFGAAARGLLSIGGIGAVLSGLAAGIKAVGVALIANPIGALVAAIVAAVVVGALAIRKYWGPISAFFSGVWDGIKAALAPLAEAFRPFIEAVKDIAGAIGTVLAPVVRPVGRLFSWLGGIIGDVVGWFGSLLTPVDASTETLDGARSAGAALGRILGGTLIEAIKLITAPIWAVAGAVSWLIENFDDLPGAAMDAVGAVRDWFAGLPGRIMDALGDLPGRLLGAVGVDLGPAGKRAVQSAIGSFIGLPGRAVGAVADFGQRMLAAVGIDLGPAGQQMVETTVAEVAKLPEQIVQFFKDLPEKIIAALGDVGAMIREKLTPDINWSDFNPFSKGEGGDSGSADSDSGGARPFPAPNRIMAKGGAFAGDRLTRYARGGAFTNSIVTRPTLFPMRDGPGLMGEAGPEAILPLARASDGSLGVRVANDRELRRPAMAATLAAAVAAAPMLAMPTPAVAAPSMPALRIAPEITVPDLPRMADAAPPGSQPVLGGVGTQPGQQGAVGPGPVGTGPDAGDGITVDITVNVQAGPGAGERDLVDLIRRELDAAGRDAATRMRGALYD